MIANGTCITTPQWFTPCKLPDYNVLCSPKKQPCVIQWFTHVNHWNTGCNAPVYIKVVVYTCKLADYTLYLVQSIFPLM